MTRLRRRRQNGERGAALVEFALIMPLLFALILGMFSGGIAYNRKITLTDAAREGARFGATMMVPAPGPSNPAAVDQWRSQVVSRIREIAGGELSTADSTICVELVDVATQPSDTSCGQANPSNATGRVVKVSASRPAQFEVIFFTRTLNLQSGMTARYERGN
jgi:Flp pilus assembly protein TadG